ncbi:MAG: carboxypeptidase M32 [Planctomycetes bacterium]|nr:carboxypeptidase M32 [Planctomycetota bacterium]
MPDTAYDAFIARVKELHTTHAIAALLEWDHETYMPKGGAADRANHMALVAGLAHEKLTADELGNLLAQLEKNDFGDDFAAATNVREIRREHDRAVKLPKSLVQDIAKASTLAREAWVEARQGSDFSKFAPHLERLLDLKRRVADLIGWTTEPYDALMDEFEPGARAAEVQAVFDGVKAELVPLVAAIKNAPRQPDKSIRERHCPRAAQEAFNRRIVEALGLDFDAGRIDVSTHPFCTSMSPRDVRITTRFDENYMPMSLFGVMHECGHALYEQGLDAAHTGTPMAQSASLGIHESQSRLWENQVGRGRPFWQHFYPQLQEAFPSLADVKMDDWCFVINTVEPSFIRVEADEVTYGLHIMLRFDIERRMIRNEIALNDIPEAWNAGMKDLLGVTPPNDAQGCLQDIHWSMGIFGYFPTYALGNLYAAQFFEAAKQAMPDVDEQLARGELKPLREWLRENVHRHGKRYRAHDLVTRVSGRDLSPQPFIDYLNAKFRPLYGLA